MGNGEFVCGRTAGVPQRLPTLKLAFHECGLYLTRFISLCQILPQCLPCPFKSEDTGNSLIFCCFISLLFSEEGMKKYIDIKMMKSKIAAVYVKPRLAELLFRLGVSPMLRLYRFKLLTFLVLQTVF